jgi:hypothetical protein
MEVDRNRQAGTGSASLAAFIRANASACRTSPQGDQRGKEHAAADRIIALLNAAEPNGAIYRVLGDSVPACNYEDRAEICASLQALIAPVDAGRRQG